MLVKFESEVGTLTMFDDVAVPLLKLMGHSGTVPSAILPQNIPAALAQLKAAVVADPDAPDPAAARREERDEQQVPVSLKQRAFPLIELLERAATRECEVTWR